MKQQLLLWKYSIGKHWENHPTAPSEKFVSFLKKNKFNGLIVDAGCDNGKHLEIFHKAGYNAVGIDISQEEINKAKELHPSLNFEVQDIENMRFKENSISALFCINVIHYVNKEQAIAEFWRCLKNKGYLFIHFNISILDEKRRVDYKHKEEDILKLVSKFKIIEKRIIKRFDNEPIKHTHKIMELILQKD